MAQFFSLHPTHPQKRLVRLAADIVRRGGVIAYGTMDTVNICRDATHAAISSISRSAPSAMQPRVQLRTVLLRPNNSISRIGP